MDHGSPAGELPEDPTFFIVFHCQILPGVPLKGTYISVAK